MQTYTLSVDKVTILESNNKDFLRLKLYAIAEGLNRNSSIFTLQAMQKAIPTIFNKPVLCNYSPLLNDAKEHDFKISTDINGNQFDYFDGSNLE